MKRFLFALITVASLMLLLAPSAQAAGKNNFFIRDYTIDYTLDRDADNRSVLMTEETIVALFPSTDQNHGIERTVPHVYKGHPTRLKVVSVLDEKGKKIPYQTIRQGNRTTIRIGDADEYVHGLQTYNITYRQHDVTHFFSDTGVNEFYWDTVGTGWRVPIHNLAVQLRVSPALAGALTGDRSCYVGQTGSSTTCQLTERDGVFRASATQLQPGENVTLAVAFAPETFAAFQKTPWMIFVELWKKVQWVTTILSAGLLVWLVGRFHRQSNRTRDMGTIVTEYLAPRDSSVIISARLIGVPYGAFAALLLDLAVRRYVQIRETKPKKGFSNAEYDIEIIKPIDDLREEEAEVVRDIFSGDVAVGSRLALKQLQTSMKIQKALRDNPTKLVKLVRGAYGLREKDAAQSGWFKRCGVIALIASVVLLSPALLLVAIVGFSSSAMLYPLTDKGLALTRYLKGLKMYIKLAEADRINMLQSPEGVEKVGTLDGDAQLLKFYEKLLPYAVLFGVEKDWNKQLGRYYETLQQQPDWYTGTTTVYSAAAFTGAMSSFSASAAASSASSSSSGGSSGGGFSGGGGGGGGGGGW